MPRANTGSLFLNGLSDFFTLLLHLERRVDPWFRPAFDALLRDPIARFTTNLINRKRPDDGLKIAEEKLLPDEEAYLDSIIDTFSQQMRKLWKPGGMERGGNTKTHGIVRGEFIIHDNLPAQFRHGIYATPQTFRAWVRFSGPGPYITPDIDDVGFMSISIKLMGVAGPKLMDEEKSTLDMFGVSPPTFVTPDVKANAQLQVESLKNAQIFYFLNFHRPHILDLIMQSLWIKTQSSPLEAPYFSCVPYLLGEDQAMQYSGLAQVEATHADSAPAFAAAGRLPARRDGCVSGRGRHRVRLPYPASNRPASHADREQRRALAGRTVAARFRRHPAPAETEVRFPRSDGICEEAFLQPLAHDRGASSVRQSEPRPTSHV